MSQKMITGCFGLAIDDNGKFLLTQRNDPSDPDAHMEWQIPGGGMEFGETPEQTMARELQEEICCIPRIIDPRPIVKVSVWPKKTDDGIDYHVTLIVYAVAIGSQIPQQTEESFDCQWYTLDEIQKLNTLPNVKEIVKEFSTIL